MNEELQSWADDLTVDEMRKEIKSLRLILQSHGEIVEENARLREALEGIERFQILTAQDMTLPMEIARQALERGE